MRSAPLPACAFLLWTLQASAGDMLASRIEVERLQRALSQPGQVELLSLDPNTDCLSDCWHGWQVLGQTTLTDAGFQHALAGELSQWVAAPEPEYIALCFNPRHGVRWTTEGTIWSFVVCFECGETRVYANEQAVGSLHLFDRASGPWDAILRASGLPLAPTESGEDDFNDD